MVRSFIVACLPGYTPKHGSWLDLAESELGVLSCQCLDRRIPDKQTLTDEIAASGCRCSQQGAPLCFPPPVV